MIHVDERIWRTEDKSYHRPFAASIGVHNRSCSTLLQRAMSDFGFERSFAKAKSSVKEHYGFEMPESALARITRAQAAEIAQVQPDKYRGALPVDGSEVIVSEADGSFVRIVQTQGRNNDRRKNKTISFQEARLCAAISAGTSQARYEATFCDVTEVGMLMGKCAKAAGWGLNTQIHAIGDGASWIQRQVRQTFGSQSSYLIDFYHLCEYLAEAAPSCSSQVKRWMNTQKKRLKAGQYLRVVNELEKHLESHKVSDEDAPVRKAHRYLNNRPDCFAYDEALQRNLPIGSGLIESGHKHVIQSRMKIPGASWHIQTAENMLQARTIRANGKWNDYWDRKAA